MEKARLHLRTISCPFAVAIVLAVAVCFTFVPQAHAGLMAGYMSDIQSQQIESQDNGIAESGTWGTCNWTLDATGKLIIGPGEGEPTGSRCPWSEYSDAVKRIVFSPTTVLPSNCAKLFAEMTQLESVDFTGVDSSAVTNMFSMFNGCSALESVNLSGLDTHNVTDMSDMFSSCSSLKSLDLSSLDVSNVTDMSEMLFGCSALGSVNLSGLDASNATDMHRMFRGCSALESADLSGLDASSATDMSEMFIGCSALESVNLSGLDTSSVTNMSEMFQGCTALGSVNLSGLDTSSVTNMSWMFQGCTALGSVNLSGLDASSVIYMNNMFQDCSTLKAVDLSDLDASRVTNMSSMFSGCSALESVDLSVLDTSSAEFMGSMFSGCSALKAVDLSDLDTSRVTNMAGMFSGCSALESVDLSVLDTSRIMNMSWMFYGCSSLKSLDLSSFDTVSTTSTPNMFDMSNMFGGCSSLESITLGEDFAFGTSCGTLGSSGSAVWGNTARGLRLSADDLVSTYDGQSMSGEWKLLPSIAGASVSGITNRTYTGKAQTQSAKLALGGAALAEGTDYDVSYRNNVNAGTATVTFTGKGGYAGSLSKTFKISPAPISKAKLALAYTAKAYTGKALRPALKTATFNGMALKKGTHYALSYKSNKAVGTATVTVTGRGNFAGAKKLTFTVKMPKPTVSLAAHAGKLTSGQKGIDVSWKMKPMPPAAQVTGYVVQFSTSKSFPKGKTRTSAVTITATNKYKALYAKRAAVATGGTYFKMRANTVYYVRVKAYRKLGGKTYATWSAAAKCRTSK